MNTILKAIIDRQLDDIFTTPNDFLCRLENVMSKILNPTEYDILWRRCIDNESTNSIAIDHRCSVENVRLNCERSITKLSKGWIVNYLLADDICIVDPTEPMHFDPYSEKSKSEVHTLDKLDLSIRPYNALKRIGITYIEDLSYLSTEDLYAIKGLGKVFIGEIIDKATEFGVIFSTESIYYGCNNVEKAIRALIDKGIGQYADRYSELDNNAREVLR